MSEPTPEDMLLSLIRTEEREGYPQPRPEVAETMAYFIGQHLKIEAEALMSSLELRPALWGQDRLPPPPEVPGGCYRASFGMVHVQPACRCPR